MVEAITTSTPDVPAPDDDEPPTATAPSDDPASTALAAVVDLLNDPAPDASAIDALFSPTFLAQIPAQQVLALLPQLRAGATGPWSVIEPQVLGFGITARLEAPGALPLSTQLQVDADAPELIVGLLFQPVPDLPEVGSAEEIVAALADLGPRQRLGLYEIVDGECLTIDDYGGADAMPIGSVYKLWIMAELSAQVERGEAAWDEEFPVQDRYKASPDGEVFGLAEGVQLTLRRYAELMISISDNSAADHLLHRLSRERVEAAMMASGVADPSLNRPILSASDLFMIKFHPDRPNSVEYRALDEDGRRAILDELADETVPWIAGPDAFPLVNAEGVSVAEPRDNDLEWFATPDDLCRTHAHLSDLAARPGLEPVAEILSINDTAGLRFDRQVWTDLRYKGGSEPGVVAVAWWMERADGRVFVLAGGVENKGTAIDPILAVGILQQGANVLADIE